MLRVIEDFCSASNQRINFSKSWVICNDDIPEDLKTLLFVDKGFVKATTDIKYLGFPYIQNLIFTRIMMVMVGKLSHRIKSWAVRPLFQARRLVMIKSVLLALPIYIMFCYKLPQFIITKLHALIVKF